MKPLLLTLRWFQFPIGLQVALCGSNSDAHFDTEKCFKRWQRRVKRFPVFVLLDKLYFHQLLLHSFFFSSFNPVSLLVCGGAERRSLAAGFADVCSPGGAPEQQVKFVWSSLLSLDKKLTEVTHCDFQ